MPPVLLTNAEKTALDLANPPLEQLFADGAVYPPGSTVILPMPGYNNPIAVAHKDSIKAAFRAALIAFMRSGAGGSGAPGQGFTNRGAWSALSNYSAYDVVTYGSGVWLAVGSSTNVVPGSNPLKWWLWAQGFAFKGSWDGGTNYVPYDVVVYSGETFVAAAASIGVTPGTDPSKWTLWAQKGAQGTAGTVLRSGTLPPDNTVGVNGDYYFRTSTGDVFLKSAGIYALTANIKGPPGAAGPAGPAGADGATTGNMPVNFNVVGTVEQSMGAIFLETGTVSIMRAYLGCQNPAHAATVKLYRASNGALITTIGGVAGGLAIRSVNNVVIPADDMYEIYLKCDTSGGIAMLRNFSWRLPA